MESFFLFFKKIRMGKRNRKLLELLYVSSLYWQEKKILASFLAEMIILRVTTSMCVRLLDRLRSSY